MLVKIARDLRSDVGVSDEDLMVDGELLLLAAKEGVETHPVPLSPPAVGMLVDGHLYFAESADHAHWRSMLAYSVARIRLFGREDATTLTDPPTSWDDRRIRSVMLSGYLILGPGFDVDCGATDRRGVARLADMPTWYVRLFCQLVRRTRAESELWRDPDLGRRVRALARARGLTTA